MLLSINQKYTNSTALTARHCCHSFNLFICHVYFHTVHIRRTSERNLVKF